LFVAEPGEPASGRLPAVEPDHPETDAVCLVQSFYAMAVQLADMLGTDVDRPRHLQKVTRTL
jgi:glucosamine--fructose-6-phosphate aminotransferase (isomerizing)